MSLYSRISAVYDELFPIDPATIDYIESVVPEGAERRLLDLGAATGGHVEAFARRGWDTLGIELDEAMAVSAALKAHVVHGSMLDADRVVVEDYGVRVHFGAILCLGNTLPHLPAEKLGRFFSMVRRLLHPGAPFIIQTLNYANPEIKPGFVFPILKGKNFSFERRYQESENPDTIKFLTRFSQGDSSEEDVTVLFPHSPEKISAELSEAGFREIRRISGWGGKDFDAKNDRYLITVGK
jgi:SAM-dependent methyltransferase